MSTEKNIQLCLYEVSEPGLLEPHMSEPSIPISLSQEAVAPKKYFTNGLEILRAEYQEQEMLLDGLLPKGCIAVCAASSDVGKSMLWRQIASSIAMNKKEVIGKVLNTTYGRAAYISTEDDKNVFAKQFKRWNLEEQDSQQLINLDVRVVDEKFPNTAFLEHASKDPYDLIVVDVLSDTLGADINDSIKVRSYFNQFKPLVRNGTTTVLFIHHINKKGELLDPSKVNILGSSAIESASRCVIDMRKDSSDKNIRYLTVTKCNYLSEAVKSKSTKLKFDESSWLFENTGDQVQLSTSINRMEQNRATRDSVLRLSKEGLSTRKISDRLKQDGVAVGKSSVSKILIESKNAEQDLSA